MIDVVAFQGLSSLPGLSGRQRQKRGCFVRSTQMSPLPGFSPRVFPGFFSIVKGSADSKVIRLVRGTNSPLGDKKTNRTKIAKSKRCPFVISGVSCSQEL